MKLCLPLSVLDLGQETDRLLSMLERGCPGFSSHCRKARAPYKQQVSGWHQPSYNTCHSLCRHWHELLFSCTLYNLIVNLHVLNFRSACESYGEVYFKAWRNSSDKTLQVIACVCCAIANNVFCMSAAQSTTWVPNGFAERTWWYVQHKHLCVNVFALCSTYCT